MVGLGLDFTEVGDYVAANDLGTARLLAALAPRRLPRPARPRQQHGRLRRGPLPSARPTATCGPRRAARPTSRRAASSRPAPSAGGRSSPPRSARTRRLEPRSVYAATKLHQEHLCAPLRPRAPGGQRRRCSATTTSTARGCRATRPTPASPASSAAPSPAAAAPRVFEDGGQLRDFIHVADIARANLAALGRRGAPPPSTSPPAAREPILAVAELLGEAAGPGAPRPEVTGEFRLGDVRHVFADPGAGARASSASRPRSTSPAGWPSSRPPICARRLAIVALTTW